MNFIRNHPLMDEAVSHESGVPVFYKGDVAFSSLVVERLKVQNFPDDKHYTVYYAGTGGVFFSIQNILKNKKIIQINLVMVGHSRRKSLQSGPVVRRDHPTGQIRVAGYIRSHIPRTHPDDGDLAQSKSNRVL